MKYNRKRVMQVPIKDHDGSLKQMLSDHKNGTHEALRFYRQRLKIIASVSIPDRQYRMKASLCRLIEAKIKRDYPELPRGSVNLTTQNSVGKPIQEFLRRKGNRKRPPRYRRMDLRLRQKHCCVDLDAKDPTIQIGFQNIGRRGVTMRSYKLYGSQRYFDRFRGMEHTVTYLNYKKGRVWANLVFSEEVNCRLPQTFLGLDAGMYSNKSAWVWALDNGSSKPLIGRIDKDETPQAAAFTLINLAKEHNAAISVENLKQLNRSRSGMRFGIPTAKFTNALVTACEDNAIALVQVNPRGTSSTHHKCNSPLIRPKDERGWDFAICNHCNEEFSADENAAINISRRGKETYNEVNL